MLALAKNPYEIPSWLNNGLSWWNEQLLLGPSNGLKRSMQGAFRQYYLLDS